jgi:hypothetical protein
LTTKPVRYLEGQFPPKKIDWERLIPLIGPASAAEPVVRAAHASLYFDNLLYGKVRAFNPKYTEG